MRTIGNILWFVLAGFWLAIAYVFMGLIACITIVGIPFGIASFRIANYVLWPFGRTVVFRPEAGVGTMIGNVIWILLCGWGLAVAHLFTGLLLCVTVIGIPFGVANWKMIPVTFVPLGRRIVPVSQANPDAFGFGVAR